MNCGSIKSCKKVRHVAKLVSSEINKNASKRSARCSFFSDRFVDLRPYAVPVARPALDGAPPYVRAVLVVEHLDDVSGCSRAALAVAMRLVEGDRVRLEVVGARPWLCGTGRRALTFSMQARSCVPVSASIRYTGRQVGFLGRDGERWSRSPPAPAPLRRRRTIPGATVCYPIVIVLSS